MENVQKNLETAPRNCRFLSLVVVERVLTRGFQVRIKSKSGQNLLAIRGRGEGCKCVKMEPFVFVFLVLFSKFYSIFRFKIGHFPLCFGSSKRRFSGPKGQMVNSGFQAKPPDVTTPQVASSQGLA